MIRATFIVALAVVVPTVIQAAEVRRAQYLMGTVCAVATSGPDAEAQIDAAFAEAKRVEAMLSTWTDDSELSRVNAGAEPGSELRALLERALEWSRRTNRAFDPRLRGLIAAWKIREGGTVPTAAAIRTAIRDLRFEEGGFGKGYALDRMLALTSGDTMIDFGGQIIVRGQREVAIADPTDRRKPVVALTIENASISTSSGSEKTFEAGGRRFSHILDPRTGEALPPRGSASVIASDAFTADILSTALYVMGEDEGLRWADANRVAVIVINPQHQIRLSAAARERARALTVLDRNYSLKD